MHSLTIDTFDKGAPKKWKKWAYFEKPTTFCKLKKDCATYEWQHKNQIRTHTQQQTPSSNALFKKECCHFQVSNYVITPTCARNNDNSIHRDPRGPPASAIDPGEAFPGSLPASQPLCDRERASKELQPAHVSRRPPTHLRHSHQARLVQVPVAGRQPHAHRVSWRQLLWHWNAHLDEGWVCHQCKHVAHMQLI